jgi:hypothetical protein
MIMKILLRLLLILLMTIFVSCETENSVETEDPSENEKSYFDFFINRVVFKIEIVDDIKYICSYLPCDTCSHSGEGTPPLWTVITNSSYSNYSIWEFLGVPKKDSKGNLYRGEFKTLYKQNINGEYELYLTFDDFFFLYFTFDKLDNIWFYGAYAGIAYWDKTNLHVYNPQNSILPVNSVNGLAVDNSGIVWVCPDGGGLLKIESGNWTIIPGSDIPGFTSYLTGPWLDNENNIWFKIYDSDTIANFLRVTDNEWSLAFPGQGTPTTILKIDSKGVLWAIDYYFLTYFKNNEWINFDSGVASQILTVNADDSLVYIGTEKGLFTKSK